MNLRKKKMHEHKFTVLGIDIFMDIPTSLWQVDFTLWTAFYGIVNLETNSRTIIYLQAVVLHAYTP